MDNIEFLKYIFPAITAIVATGLTLFFQYLSKKVELDKQNEFKAREYLFKIKEKHIDDSLELFTKFQNAFASFGRRIILSKSEQQKREILKLVNKSFGQIFRLDKSIIENVTEELSSDLDSNNIVERFYKVKKFFNLDFENESIVVLEESFFEIMYYIQNLVNFIRKNQEKEAIKVFQKYVSD